ncbi:hypothetical protein QYE76_000611 [Lolium multiflorum]|uniref:Reverse transcriptase Ty1/copia-type domain-containing protein n=1 Tax=Lolium multiflorum TaxID=4521 RepID=A0AAD8VYW8_LOLMU|nr:hypothetical protein QYE76_000611 [Lolium multiflorum]
MPPKRPWERSQSRQPGIPTARAQAQPPPEAARRCPGRPPREIEGTASNGSGQAHLGAETPPRTPAAPPAPMQQGRSSHRSLPGRRPESKRRRADDTVLVGSAFCLRPNRRTPTTFGSRARRRRGKGRRQRRRGRRPVERVGVGGGEPPVSPGFLIVKSEVSDMHVGTIMESNDATFFEDIFPMKDMPNSSNQGMPSTSIQEFATIPESTIPIEHLENPEEDNNEAPKRSKRQRTAKSFGNDFIVYLVDDTPTSISEAYASPDADYWKEAVRSEMDSILANGTWEITDRPYGCKPVGCKWVFKKKLRPDGTIEKYKARLVAKGYTQKEAPLSVPIKEVTPLQRYTTRHSTICAYRLLHPVYRRAPLDGTAGLRNPVSCDPVRERRDKVFRERSTVTAGFNIDTEADDYFPNDDFFPDISNLFGDMALNSDNGNAGSSSAPGNKELISMARSRSSTSSVASNIMDRGKQIETGLVDFVPHPPSRLDAYAYLEEPMKMTFGKFDFRVEKEGVYRLEVPISSGFSSGGSDLSNSVSSVESSDKEISSPRFIDSRASEKLARIFSDMSFESSADSYISDDSSDTDSFDFINKSTSIGKVFTKLYGGVTEPSKVKTPKYHQVFAIGDASRDQEETSEAFDDLGNPYVDPSDLRRGHLQEIQGRLCTTWQWQELKPWERRLYQHRQKELQGKIVHDLRQQQQQQMSKEQVEQETRQHKQG